VKAYFGTFRKHDFAARRISARFGRVTDAIYMAHVQGETGDIDTALAELRKALAR
jgi:hypothetical protein